MMDFERFGKELERWLFRPLREIEADLTQEFSYLKTKIYTQNYTGPIQDRVCSLNLSCSIQVTDLPFRAGLSIWATQLQYREYLPISIYAIVDWDTDDFDETDYYLAVGAGENDWDAIEKIFQSIIIELPVMQETLRATIIKCADFSVKARERRLRDEAYERE
jgi:hypothetical protein